MSRTGTIKIGTSGWRCNPDRLASFLEALPDSHRTAFEFRDPSWFADRVLELLAEHGAAFCISELAGEASPKYIAADIVYLRLLGPGRKASTGSYDRQALAGWAGACDAWARSGRDVWCFFDNEEDAPANANAIELREMVGG